ncbi:MAG TPA: hypothetical protein VFR36_05880 [Sphingomicrobium sp.]|nr:hypothetical protein [Sphingomicrobium sp.]
MMRFAALTIPALLVAACDGGAPSAPPLQNDIMVRSDAQQKLFDLNDLDRAIALKRAITDQGLRCGQIVSTGFVTRFRDMDMWTATCNDERQWALFVGANDSVQVRLCADNEQIGLPACTVQPGTEGGTGLENLAGE